MNCKGCGSNLTASVCNYCSRDNYVSFISKEKFEEYRRHPFFVEENNINSDILGYLGFYTIIKDW